MQNISNKYAVCALYKFTALNNYAEFQSQVLSRLKHNKIQGTVLLASEGINGTITGETPNMDDFLNWLNGQPGLNDIEIKKSFIDYLPFKRTRVKLKKEIVTMGVEDIDPEHYAGTYVDPSDWNSLLDDPDVLLVDTRNEYEIGVGSFENAVNPHTTNFREFPEFVKKKLDSSRHKKIAMYCTGGIRCEKSTAYLKKNGFNEVYHLKGGVLKYLEKVAKNESKWQGECFVFDERVTVDHNLRKGSYDQCHACRLPISEVDKNSHKYKSGVSCPACFEKSSAEDKARYAEREKQVNLAEKRGGTHIGPPDK